MTAIEAPAKINLFLEILDLRSDGYHDVCLVNQTVDLVDRIGIDPQPDGGDRLEITGPFAAAVPTDQEDNTILRVLNLLRDRWPGVPFFSVRLDKQIPLGAGLGGGSSDAARVAVEVAKRFRPSLRREDLIHLLATVGSDMPFAVAGGTARVEGRGEKVGEVSFPFPEIGYVLVSPPLEISTGWAYRSLDEIGGRPRRSPDDLLRALEEEDFDGFAHGVWNTFEAVVFAEYPQLAEMLALMEEAGCDAAWMTGSGSNLVGLCRDHGKAGSVKAALGERIDCPVRVIRPFGPKEETGEECH